MPKPAKLPEWARLNVPDPVSGQNNVVEPPDEVKDEGWRLGEKPNRQWWNWFNRTVNDWITYFDENLDFDADNFVPAWTGLDIGSISQNYGYYSKEGDRVYFTIHTIWGGNANAGGLTITNMPYPAKNQAGIIQSCHVSRGVGPTLAGQGVISAIIGANSTTLVIWAENTATGTGANANTAGSTGQLILTGFYFIEPTP